jgi:hypothetical protein
MTKVALITIENNYENVKKIMKSNKAQREERVEKRGVNCHC